MEMLIVIAAAIPAWVAGAIWYRLTDRIYGESSALQVRNTGHPLSRSVTRADPSGRNAMPHGTSSRFATVPITFGRAERGGEALIDGVWPGD